MKIKVFLGLSAALFMAMLGGVVSTTVMAQYQMVPTPMPQPTNRIVWDYDSEWVDILAGDQLNFDHNLGGDPGEYFVYVLGRTNTGYCHQLSFGTKGLNQGERQGLLWGGCSSTSIYVYREIDETLGHWDEVRIRILKNQ